MRVWFTWNSDNYPRQLVNETYTIYMHEEL